MVQRPFCGPGPPHNPAVRSLVRFRWLVPVIAVPLCVLVTALGIQAAGLRRPSRDDLVAAQVLHTLLGYHVIRSTEAIGTHTSPAICVQGWFRVAQHRRPVRGDLVLIGRRDRLYDFGSGIRRFGAKHRAHGVDLVRFMLAGCPRFIDTQVGNGLVRNARIDVDSLRADGLVTDSMVFGRRAGVDLFVDPHTYTPVELALLRGKVTGSSDLAPGGSSAIVRLVRRAFHLPTRSERGA